MQEKQFVKQYYDDHVKAKLRNYILGSPRVDKAFQALLEFIPQNVGSILEIGCGIGHIPDRLARQFPGAQVVGFDISEKSVECAKSLFTLPNVTFVQADRVTDLPANSVQCFEVIIMMDVYEHIPLEERPGLHQFIREKLAENGILFLSCPMPAFLAWLKDNDPERIQPVDQDIDILTLLSLANDSGTRLVHYAEKDIWHKGDYFYAIFSKKPFFYGKRLNHLTGKAASFGRKIRRKAVGKWEKIVPGKAAKQREARRVHVAKITGFEL